MTTNDFPGNLSTNTYILHDYSEIAYIVCTAAIPATAGRPNNVQDATADHRPLERLRNAEQQFRQASILTILDTEKLELFTFYKKVDIVKDQKTILTKFGHVCKLNHCIIACKNACRVIELLKHENARIFRLFSAAILSSLQLQATGGKKAIRVNSQIWLLQSGEPISEDWSPTPRSGARWNLEKVDLQVIPNGQLLLAVRAAIWPNLVAMTDLIDLDVWPLDYTRPVTLFLLPTGQLARYKGTWVTSTEFTHDLDGTKTDEEVAILRRQRRWVERVSTWLESRSTISVAKDTVWLEAEIPVLVENEQHVEVLSWKVIYWPAALSYAFELLNDADVSKEPDTRDPLQVAVEWATSSVAAVQDSIVDAQSVHATFDPGQYRLFDDDPQFGSPRNSMSVPMQTFAQSQMIYPTPPEGMNTQPTPGMSVDGMVQTPATIGQIMNGHFNSSPVAVINSEPQPSSVPQAITNSLDHTSDENDDLFDEIDDDRLRHASLDHEPNWDFFNSETLASGSKDIESEHQLPLKKDSMEGNNTLSTEASGTVASPIEVSPKQDTFANESLDDPEDLQQTEHDIQPATLATKREAEDSVAVPTRSLDVGDKTVEEQAPQEVDRLSTGKRRRSSAYDIVLPKETQRDLRYSKDGKYWFQPKRTQETKPKELPPVPLYRPSSSSSDSSDLPSDSADVDNSLPLPMTAHPWIEYIPTETKQIADKNTSTDLSVAEIDTDIEALIKVISNATAREPFTSLMPIPPVRKPVIEKDLSQFFSMILQTLADQVAKSSLLKECTGLVLPSNHQLAMGDVNIDNAGVNMALSSISLADLAASSPPSASNKNPRLRVLPHGKICLQQADNKIAADLSILVFWETLNLQPVSGPKITQSLCICPKTDAFSRGGGLFLQRMSETWVSCNLGEQRLMNLKDLTTDGLLMWDTSTELLQFCRDVGAALAEDESGICTVLYLVVPRNDPREYVQLCRCFLELSEVMIDNENRGVNDGEVVLQLIPASLVIGTDTIAVPPEEQLVHLALETYTRIPRTYPADSGLIAPAIILSETNSSTPIFELNSTSASPLARHGLGCHLVYCVSLDNKWLVASWSDSIGNIATTVVYMLQDEDGAMLNSRLEIFQHMCDVCDAMMSRQKQRWWLTIAKTGLFDGEELQNWSIATTQLSKEQKMLNRIALLSLEIQPRVILRNNSGTTKLVSYASQFQTALNTPVTTPQAAQMTSPEQATPMTPTAMPTSGLGAPTPPEYTFELSNEAEIYLTDTKEDSWSIILPFGLNQSHDFLEIRPAQASGFLAKRAASSSGTDSTLALFGVNLIAVPRKANTASVMTSAEREQILEEILEQYRGLHVLALARRIVDGHDSPIPCHVASAYRTATFLQNFA